MDPFMVKRLRNNDPDLVHLSFVGQHWGPDEAEALARALSHNNTVQSIRLGRNAIGFRGSASIARVLKSNATIEYVDMSKNDIGNRGMSEFAEALRENQTLKVLKLSESGIGDEGLNDLSESVLERTCVLTRLELMGNMFGTAGFIALSKAFQRSMPRLFTLNLSWNVLDERGMQHLADGIARSATISSLNLSMCDLSTDSVRILAGGLQVNKTIENLDLSGNNIDGKGTSYLVDALLEHPRIENINLKSNNVGEDGVKAVSTLVENRSRISLNLLFNDLDITGAKALAIAIRKNPSCTRPVLRYLSIIKKSLASKAITMAPLKLFSYLTDLYVDFQKPVVRKILLGAVYGAGIQQIQMNLFHNEQTHLVPLAMWRVGSKLHLDGFYELLRSKPELICGV